MFIDSLTKSVNEPIEIKLEANEVFPVTLLVPKSSLPATYPGPLRDAEGALALWRTLTVCALQELGEAEASGRRKKIEVATKESVEAGKAWVEAEIGVASLLVKRGIPLQGRSAVVLK
ncbi:hypothetical protein ACXR2T_09805 [Leucobacter sp. HY1910]